MALECLVCGKTYQRTTHLRRHEASHDTSSHFACPYCHKDFVRRDVCRKHAATCPCRPEDAGASMIPPSKRGQKPKVCSACSQSKLSCDLGTPCGRCKDRGIQCTYDRMPPEDVLRAASAAAHSVQDVSFEQDNKASITFLLDMTHPSADSLMAVFNEEMPAEPDPDFSTPPSIDFSPDQMDYMTDFIFPPVINFDDFMPATRMGGQGFFDVDFTLLDLETKSPALDHNLSMIHAGLREEFHRRPEYLTSQASSPPSLSMSSPPTFDDLAAETLLKPNHARILVATYFRTAVPDFPVTHEASFSFEDSGPELLLANMLSGSLRCAPHDYILAARKLMRIGVGFILRQLKQCMDETKSQEGSLGLPTLMPRRLMDLVCAALIANAALSTVPEIAEHDLRSGWRMESLNQLAAIVRQLGIYQVRRSKSVVELDWETFIYEESCIRIANWSAMNSWLQSGCLNAPPVMGTAELQASLPCPLELWQARDAYEFATLQKQYRERQPPIEPIVKPNPSSKAPLSPATAGPPTCIAECMDLLMCDEKRWVGVAAVFSTTINRVDLIILIIALHSVILTSRQNGILPQIAPTLRRAITRWRKLWVVTDPSHMAGQTAMTSHPAPSLHQQPLPSAFLPTTTTTTIPSISTNESTAYPSLPSFAQQPPKTESSSTTSSQPQEPLRGLHRHAVALAWLALCLIDPRTWTLPRFTRECKYLGNVGFASMTDLHEFMGMCRRELSQR